MTSIRKQILIALAVLGMGAAGAQAQTAPAPAPAAPNHGHMHASMAEHFRKHMAKLHDKLALTAEQEPAWTAYVAAITPAAPAAGANRPNRATMAAMSAPDRMDMMLTEARSHIATMEAHLAALKTFYAVLSAEQKMTFDASAGDGWHGQHRMMKHAQ